jgi:hypothetical protein
VRTDQRAVAEPGQIPTLLFLGAEARDRTLHRPQLRIQRERQPVVRTPFADAFHHQHGRRQVDLGAAILGRHGHPENPEPGAALPQRAVEAALVIPRA